LFTDLEVVVDLSARHVESVDRSLRGRDAHRRSRTINIIPLITLEITVMPRSHRPQCQRQN